MRMLLTGLGFVSVGFGVAGFFIPIWPTTVFFIVALGLFAKSNPKAEAWLVNHRRIGPLLVDWRNGRRIARKAKWTALIGIVLSFAVSIFLVKLLWLQVVLLAVMACLLAFIVSRPEPPIADLADQTTARSA